MALASWLSKTVLPRLRRHAPLLLAGAFVVFLAGGASMARFVRNAPRPQPLPAGAPAEPESAPAAAVPVSELPLQLLASSVGSEPARSVALVLDTERAAPQLMREGDAPKFHPEVRLTRIEPARALIDNRGRTEMLELGPDTSLVDRLLAGADPAPVYADGALTGVELHDVRPDGVYARMGLRNGDRIGAINGVALGSSEASGELLRALVESPEIELTVERGDGTPAHIAVPREKLLGPLGARE